MKLFKINLWDLRPLFVVTVPVSLTSTVLDQSRKGLNFSETDYGTPQPNQVVPGAFFDCKVILGAKNLFRKSSPHLPNWTQQFIMLSSIYCQLLVVVCVVLLTSEVVTGRQPLLFFSESFFLYLYAASLLFLVYVYLYLLRHGNTHTSAAHGTVRRPPPPRPKREGGLFSMRKMAPMPKSGSPPVDSDVVTSSGDTTDTKYQEHTALNGINGNASAVPRVVKQRISENDRSHGSLFLRVGAIAFGLGTMVYNGLEFGSYFEIPTSSRCYSPLLAVNPVLQMAFTFAQMYFIFMNARVVARFGLMHIVATNICVWIRTLGKETLQEILSHEVGGVKNRSVAIEDAVLTFRARANKSESCERVDIMGSIVVDASPFLYPFIIEYSLISAAVLYVMWKNIGKDPIFQVERSMTADASTDDQLSRTSSSMFQTFSGNTGGTTAPLSSASGMLTHHRVNCAGSSKGLFLGLLMLVCSTICLIVFFVLVQHKRYELVAIYMSDVSHCGIKVLTIFAILIGFIRVRHLRFHPDRNDHLRSILLSVSSFGLYVYSVFGIIAGALLPKDQVPNSLLLLTSILTIIQVTLQSLFIADVTCRSTYLPEHDRTKPGRQAVTFLLISNLTLWIIYTFEMQKVEASPVQLGFYGFFAWTFIIRSSLPLSIFYRFHSSVTFAEVWKNSYRDVMH
ncbi:otopetrin-2-like [Tropilaelaps mercedesae]|uniref:Otopetrin-2-like n=1 Tax=Tropilaelaps mercedesae TaxID=418985 RepID=A0A1V9XYE0_9ACAR|nr:otopetrin-2-like [Tropilaelaps mercedesae]